MSDLAEWKLKGPVRELRTEHAEWNAERGEWGEPRGLATVSFRPDGQFSENESQNPDGSFARSAHLYDDRGRLVETQSWMNDGPRRRVRYSYDGEGRLASAIETSPDGSQKEVESYRYDEAGRQTKVHNFEGQGSNFSVGFGVEGVVHGYPAPGAVMSTTTHDRFDRPAEIRFVNGDQELVLRIVFSRDTLGRLLSETVYINHETAFTFSPDEDAAAEYPGFAEVLAQAFADNTFASTTYAYDDHGRVSERIVRFSSLSEERTTLEYDDHDNPVAEISHKRNQRMV